MSDNGQTKTLSPEDVHRNYGAEKYHNIEVLEDGTIRETTSDGDSVTESVTRSLKTERTWY